MNRVVHFEFNVPDTDQSTTFFTRVFGWKISKWNGPEEYYLVTTGETGETGINGGIMRSRDGQPRTVNSIEVDSVDEYARKVEENGGKIVVPKMPIPGVGWLAYALDPGGVLFGITSTDPTAK